MVSVIVATKNREESLKRCIRSLFKNDLRGVEIIIVYSGRFNNTEKIWRAYKCEKKSLVEARDLGWRKAKGEIVVYIDDDVEVTKDWLKAIKETFKDKNVGGASGPTIVSKEELKNRDVFKIPNKNYNGYKNYNFFLRLFYGIVGWFYRIIILEGREKEVGKICRSGMWTPGSNFYKGSNVLEVDYLEACNMALRRSLIEKVGGFDLGFKGTSEWCEVDLAMRIKERASQDSPLRLVFNPKAKVYHHVSREGVYNARENSSERMDNFLRYYLKHFKVNWRFIMAVIFMKGYFLYKWMSR